jgi:hypothetical protein
MVRGRRQCHRGAWRCSGGARGCGGLDRLARSPTPPPRLPRPRHLCYAGAQRSLALALIERGSSALANHQPGNHGVDLGVPDRKEGAKRIQFGRGAQGATVLAV